MSDKARLQRALEATEARLAAGPATLDLKAERARLLAALGLTEAAKAQHLEILAEDSAHFATLNDLGALLVETNYRTAARTLFTQAVTRHPQEPLGHVNLADLLMYAGELDEARAHYEIALRLDPQNAGAHQRLGELFHELGDVDAARRHRRLGFAGQPRRTLPYLGDGDPIRMLLLTSTPTGDVAWPRLVDNRRFSVTTLTAEFDDPAAPLPPHDLIFNAIGDADLCAADLRAATAVAARSDAPVVNHPAKVALTGRTANAERLGLLGGVTTPRMAALPREALAANESPGVVAGLGLGFPLLLRSPGFHTGRHFVRVDRPDDLAAAAHALPGDELVAIQPIGAFGADGYARKYRVMMIGGRLYPLHLAVSRDWKVHYATGAMDGAVGLQADEARFLEHMPQVLGARAMAGLAAIQAALGLDYAGADFALGAAGEVLLFEANATMNIIAPDADPQWDYRRPAIERALAAARAMLAGAARERSISSED